MKNLLIVAATEPEIAPLLRFLEANFRNPAPNSFQNEQYSIDILISGVGMMPSAFHIGYRLASRIYDAAIQAGIAGSFDTSIPLGTVVGVSSETFGDLGAEDKEQYLSIFDLGFLEADRYPFEQGKLRNKHPFNIGIELQMLPAISVNTVSGHSPTINARAARNNAVLESMEGIAFHYACLQQQIPFLQIRAISNYVTPRDRDSWQIGPAIANLNQVLISFFGRLP
jgi:futalosine hydrolase